MKFKIAIAGMALVFSVISAQAAVVSSERGEVLANPGNGFKAVQRSGEFPAGTQILVRPGGVASIKYEGGCTVRFGAGRLAVVQKSAPCVSGKNLIDLTQRMNQSSDNNGAADANCLILNPSGECGLTHTDALVGGLVAGGVGAGIYFLVEDDDDRPASP